MIHTKSLTRVYRHIISQAQVANFHNDHAAAAAFFWCAAELERAFPILTKEQPKPAASTPAGMTPAEAEEAGRRLYEQVTRRPTSPFGFAPGGKGESR
jgi:hypothetical protein